MKLIYLNALVSIPNTSGEEKIEKAINKKGYNPNKDKTPPKSWFLEQNLIPPEDTEEDVETDENGNVFLEEKDLEEVAVPLSIPLENVGSWVASVDGGTTLYTKSNLMYDVLEEVWEIDAIVELLNMSWFEKQYLYFKSFFSSFFAEKNKIIEENE